MDLKRKMELAKQHVTSISRHDDADLAVRHAALDGLIAFAESEKAAAVERVQIKIAAALGEAEQPAAAGEPAAG